MKIVHISDITCFGVYVHCAIIKHIYKYVSLHRCWSFLYVQDFPHSVLLGSLDYALHYSHFQPCYCATVPQDSLLYLSIIEYPLFRLPHIFLPHHLPGSDNHCFTLSFYRINSIRFCICKITLSLFSVHGLFHQPQSSSVSLFCK